MLIFNVECLCWTMNLFKLDNPIIMATIAYSFFNNFFGIINKNCIIFYTSISFLVSLEMIVNSKWYVRFDERKSKNQNVELVHCQPKRIHKLVYCTILNVIDIFHLLTKNFQNLGSKWKRTQFQSLGLLAYHLWNSFIFSMAFDKCVIGSHMHSLMLKPCQWMRYYN